MSVMFNFKLVLLIVNRVKKRKMPQFLKGLLVVDIYSAANLPDLDWGGK